MDSGIYTIGTPSGKLYVGSAVNFKKRWQLHLSHLRRGVHNNPYLQNAYNKYGDELTFTVQLRCERADLLLREQEFIDAIPVALRMNVALDATAPMLGRKATPMTRALLSEIVAARWRDPDFKHAVAAKISDAHRGRKHTAEHRENHAAALRGRKHTEEHKTKISDGARGRPVSEETRAKIGAANSRATNTSGYKGVSFSKPHGKWAAYAYNAGKKKHIGLYDTAEQADAARTAYIKEM